MCERNSRTSIYPRRLLIVLLYSHNLILIDNYIIYFTKNQK